MLFREAKVRVAGGYRVGWHSSRFMGGKWKHPLKLNSICLSLAGNILFYLYLWSPNLYVVCILSIIFLKHYNTNTLNS